MSKYECNNNIVDIRYNKNNILFGSLASRKYNPPFSGSALFCADPLSGSESRSVT